MAKFSVGEIVLAQNGLGGWDEAEILELPGQISTHFDFRDKRPDTYVIRVPGTANSVGTDVWQCEEQKLKKKQPPQRECDRKVSWDDCLWKPKEIEVRNERGEKKKILIGSLAYPNVYR